MKLLYIVLFLFSLAACRSRERQNPSDSSDERSRQVFQYSAENSDEEDEYGDGTWCADVEYFNPNTGTNNTYSLDVEVEDGELVQINWSNGGWMDGSHFMAEDISSGECSFTSDKGYEYTVTLNTKGGCGYSDAYRMRNHIERELKVSTCPRCGNEKEKYEELCNDCQDEAETCPKCYGLKFEWEAICSSCQHKMDKEQEENDENF